MTLLWTWGGDFFGYMDGYALWTYDGRHVGRFIKMEAYGKNGDYLGEIKSENRLITNTSKKHTKRGSFTPHAKRAGIAKYAKYAGYAMYAGHEDFPLSENINDYMLWPLYCLICLI